MENMRLKIAAVAVSIALGTTTANAQSINGTDILNLLVEEGILTQEAAGKLIEKVRQRNQQPQQLDEKVVTSTNGNTLRVPYVPNYVKDEIKADVAQQVRGQVLEDVISHAKTERWGIPNAQPSWTKNVSFSGDARLRYEADFYDDDNPDISKGDEPIVDLNVINDVGHINEIGRDAYVNVVDDRHRLRGQFRVKMKAQPTEGVEVGMRLSTGNEGNPVSTNQTLGEYGAKWASSFDLAYLKYNNLAKSITLEGGRIANPFLYTDLVWDNDMTFEGVAGKWNFLRSDHLDDDSRQWDPFLTLGAFPIEEINVARIAADTASAPDDKWLYAAQLGTNFESWTQNRFSIGLSYYHYENITGISNEFDNDLQNATAPALWQSGNWYYNIVQRTSSSDDSVLLALASEYRIAGLTMSYDYAGFAPYRVVITGDAVKNLAFDSDEILARTGEPEGSLPERDEGYQFGVKVGWPKLDLRGNWNMSFVYRHLEGDAVLDAFSDSDFLLGGTNAKGYILRGDYALLDNVYASMRWLSAEEIDADVSESVAIDRLFIDLGATF